jgi:integrase
MIVLASASNRAPDRGYRMVTAWVRPAGPACASTASGLRHAHAVEMAREGVPLIVVQRRLGHTNLGITSIYLQGSRQRRPPGHAQEARPAASRHKASASCGLGQTTAQDEQQAPVGARAEAVPLLHP